MKTQCVCENDDENDDTCRSGMHARVRALCLVLACVFTNELLVCYMFCLCHTPPHTNTTLFMDLCDYIVLPADTRQAIPSF